MTYLVQSVIFDKSKFSLENAKAWLHENKYKDKGVDEKKKMWRFRQLNPLTIKRKGYSHYITKPLDNSGVELIIAYKEKMEGAGKLNQIKKALFNHFKKDEKLESKIVSTLGMVDKEANNIVKALIQHDKADDKPQNQIINMLSKLNNNNNINISGKGFKDKTPYNISKDKMTTQEAKLYMSGIMTTGGSLDLSQDVAFRLKYSFKVGELKKMLKELATEGKINLTPKEIRKLKKAEIIAMVVQGELINPPELPTSVALAKKFKVGDLKKEALDHAKTVNDTKTFLSSIRKMKKAELINYIELNNLYLVQEQEQPNIEMNIEEIVEPVEKKKKSKKPKKKLIIEEDEIEDESKKEIKLENIEEDGKEYATLDWTDEEIALLPELEKNNRTNNIWWAYMKALKQSKDGKVPLYINFTKNSKGNDFILYKNRVYIKTDWDIKKSLKYPDEELKALNSTLKYFLTDKKKDERYKKENKKKEIVSSKKAEPALKESEDEILENRKDSITAYMNKGYQYRDACEAVLRDYYYYKEIGEQALKEGKEIHELEEKPKSLTKKEKADIRENEYLTELRVDLQKPENKKQLALIQKYQPIFIVKVKKSGYDVPLNIQAYMVLKYMEFTPKSLEDSIYLVNNEVRNHKQYFIEDMMSDKMKKAKSKK